jgi:hypothetical protein
LRRNMPRNAPHKMHTNTIADINNGLTALFPHVSTTH